LKTFFQCSSALQCRVHLRILARWRNKGHNRINFSSKQPKTTKLFNAFCSQNENQCLLGGLVGNSEHIKAICPGALHLQLQFAGVEMPPNLWAVHSGLM